LSREIINRDADAFVTAEGGAAYCRSRATAEPELLPRVLTETPVGLPASSSAAPRFRSTNKSLDNCGRVLYLF